MGDRKVQVEGHCDERGTNEYNMVLGMNRAKAAMNYLRSMGVEGDRMSTVSYGEELPLDPAHDEGAWAKNRRAHFNLQ
jgi:peptidoglycan-associated lipoprotein